MLQGTNSAFNRAYNLRVVLEAVRRNQPVSRSEIARVTGLTLQAVSNIVAELVRKGLLLERGRRTVSRGQPPIEYVVNASIAYSVGINLDRDRLIGVLMDLAGEVLDRVSFKLDHPSPDEAIGLFQQVSRRLLGRFAPRDRRVLGVGIALPTGKTVDPPDFPGWNSAGIRRTLSEILDLPVYVDNDGTVAAIGERWYGRGSAFDDFFFVYFSVGLGGGGILNGQPFRGAGGNAGEIGHIPVQPGGRRCSCGGSGCLERYVSLRALYESLGAEGITVPDSGALKTLFREGNPHLMKWLEDAATLLPRALVTVENLFDVRAVFFGGRLPDPLLDHLIARLRATTPSLRMRGRSYDLELLKATAGDDAVAKGAATVLMYETLAPTQDVIFSPSDTAREGGASDTSRWLS